MSSTTYRYLGPDSAMTLCVADDLGGQHEQDIFLWHGHLVELPDQHEVIEALRHQGLLETLNERH